MLADLCHIYKERLIKCSLTFLHSLKSGSPIFKESDLWADSLFKSKCPYVRLFVCPWHFLSPLNGLFLPPLPKVQCPIFLGIRNSKGKVILWSGLRFFLKNGLKSLRRDFFFLQIFFHSITPFKRFFAPTSQSPMSKLLKFSKSLGKNYDQKWSKIWKLLLVKIVKITPKKLFFLWQILPDRKNKFHSYMTPKMNIGL